MTLYFSVLNERDDSFYYYANLLPIYKKPFKNKQVCEMFSGCYISPKNKKLRFYKYIYIFIDCIQNLHDCVQNLHDNIWISSSNSRQYTDID